VLSWSERWSDAVDQPQVASLHQCRAADVQAPAYNPARPEENAETFLSFQQYFDL
jgi:hypothetical protein